MNQFTKEEEYQIQTIKNENQEKFLTQWSHQFLNDLEPWVFIYYELSNDRNASTLFLEKVQERIGGQENLLSPLMAAMFFHYQAYYLWRQKNRILHAQNHLLKALEVLQNSFEKQHLIYKGRIFDTLGLLNKTQSQLTEAASMFQWAIDYKTKGDDKEGLAISYGNLGRLNMELGQFPEAIKYLNLDIQLMETHFSENLFVRAQLLSTVAWAYLEHNQLKEATEKYEESKGLNTSLNNPTGLFYNDIGLAEIALKKGELEKSKHFASCAKSFLKHADFFKPAFSSSEIQYVYVASLIQIEESNKVDAYQSLLDLILRKKEDINQIQLAKIYLSLAELDEGDQRASFLKKSLEILDQTEHANLRMLVEERLKKASKSDFLLHAAGRFAGRAQMEQLIEKAGSEGFQGQENELAVLFSDIRGFTTLSEKLTPPELIITLNRFFTLMTRVITHYGGYVDKFIGDAIMAVFSFPKEGEPTQNNCEQAVRAALHMRAELNRFKITLGEGLENLDVGVGIHYGKMVSGIIGSPQKRSFTVIGDAVNTASRLEGLTKQLGASLVISEEVKERLIKPSDFIIRPMGAYRPKGKKNPIGLYDVAGFVYQDFESQQLLQEARILEHYHQMCTMNQKEQAQQQLKLLLNNDYQLYKAGYHLLNQYFLKYQSDIDFEKWDKVIDLVSK